MKKVKLIWDFRGDDAIKTAEHHEHHLEEYIEMKQLKNRLTGVDILSEVYANAYMIVDEEEVIGVRDALRPHRGEWVEIPAE
ncbi:MAG TPA: hypothetical protein PLI97_04090 [Fluviicola sp.]|nr:hypothetical protein [Fluviicola sp.]